MTPAEQKAKELIEKFELPSGLMGIERKQCALIDIQNSIDLLNEIDFEFMKYEHSIESSNFISNKLVQFLEVKKAIEKY